MLVNALNRKRCVTSLVLVKGRKIGWVHQGKTTAGVEVSPYEVTETLELAITKDSLLYLVCTVFFGSVGWI
jgi:hypothetical protein